MLKIYFYIISILIFPVWATPIYYANKHTDITKSTSKDGESVGTLYWGEMAKVITFSTLANWVKIKRICNSHEQPTIGWVPRQALKSSKTFKKVSIWHIKKYTIDTSMPLYFSEIHINFSHSDKAQVIIHKAHSSQKHNACFTYRAGSLVQLRCRNNYVLTIPFNQETGYLQTLPPCSDRNSNIGSDGDILALEKFTYSTHPTPKALTQINEWLKARLIGHDNGNAKFSSVRIYRDGKRYKIHFKSQFNTTCEIKFDATGQPYIIQACTSPTFDGLPKNAIFLACTSNKQETTCTGNWNGKLPLSYIPHQNDSLDRLAIVLKHKLK